MTFSGGIQPRRKISSAPHGGDIVDFIYIDRSITSLIISCVFVFVSLWPT